VARRAHNPKVVGSNPAPAMKNAARGAPRAAVFFPSCRAAGPVRTGAGASIRFAPRRRRTEARRMTLAPTIPLAHGAAIPQLGLGTWPMDDAQCEAAVATAIEAGYRLIDTAENYGNERGVGRGLRASGVPREELFITTKLNKEWHGADLVAEAFERSAERFGLDYLHIFLIHWPNPGQDRYVEAWQGLIRLLEAGRVRAIGTPNFMIAHFQRIIVAT